MNPYLEAKGIEVVEKIGALRMQAAAHLLLASDLTERQVALQVGYQSRRIFENHFFRRFGMTSAEYRAHERNCWFVNDV